MKARDERVALMNEVWVLVESKPSYFLTRFPPDSWGHSYA